jgi:hypothetical protein
LSKPGRKKTDFSIMASNRVVAYAVLTRLHLDGSTP